MWWFLFGYVWEFYGRNVVIMGILQFGGVLIVWLVVQLSMVCVVLLEGIGCFSVVCYDNGYICVSVWLLCYF